MIYNISVPYPGVDKVFLLQVYILLVSKFLFS